MKEAWLPGAFILPYTACLQRNTSPRPGDNQYACSAGFGCGNPTLSLDAYNPYGNRYVDIVAGGPSPFTFNATSNVPWVKISPSQASVTTDSPEQRVYLSVDWSQVSGAQSAKITFTATVEGQSSQTNGLNLNVNHTVIASGFHGAVSIFSVILTCGRSYSSWALRPCRVCRGRWNGIHRGRARGSKHVRQRSSVG